MANGDNPSDEILAHETMESTISEAVASVHKDTGHQLSEDQALLVAWERSVLLVAMQGPNSPADPMYHYGRCEIVRRMGEV